MINFEMSKESSSNKSSPYDGERTISPPYFLGIDVISDRIKSDKPIKEMSKVIIDDDTIVDYVISGSQYIKELVIKCINSVDIGNLDNIKYYYKNTNVKRIFPYKVRHLLDVNNDIKQFLFNGFLIDYIQLFSHAYYIADTKRDQEYVISSFMKKLDIYSLYEVNTLSEFIKYDHTIVDGSKVKYLTDTYKKELITPFIDFDLSIDMIKNIDILSYLNELNDVIKKTYKSKLYTDITKGKIKNNCNLNNTILFLFYLITVFIEVFIRNLYDVLKIVENLQDYITYPNTPIYFPEHIRDIVDFHMDRKKDPYENSLHFTQEDELTLVLSSEADDSDKASAAKLDENYKKQQEEAYKLYLRTVRLATNNIKNWIDIKFFKKHLGRIKDLFEHANDENATVVENTVNDDPVTILKEKGPEIVNRIGNGSIALFEDIISVSKQVYKTDDLDRKLKAIKSFCKTYKIENDEPKEIYTNIIKETRLRIAQAIIKNIKVYGYTIESIVENGKMPPASHIVASIFLKDPFAKAQEQKISDIFSSPDNISIFANSDFTSFFAKVYKGASEKIMTNINSKDSIQTVAGIERSFSNFTTSFARGIKMGSVNKSDLLKSKAKVRAINKGLKKAVQLSWRQKFRSLQLVDSMLSMSREIIKLAKRCLVILINIDNAKRDTKYNVGQTSGGKDSKAASKYYKAPTAVTIDPTK